MAYGAPPQTRECRAAARELLNIAFTCQKEAPTDRKMSRCCPAFSGLCASPPFTERGRGPLFGRTC